MIGIVIWQLLSVFGVVLMLLVGAVSLITTWTSEDMTSPADLPMFAPLMWIAIGIFTGTCVPDCVPFVAWMVTLMVPFKLVGGCSCERGSAEPVGAHDPRDPSV